MTPHRKPGGTRRGGQFGAEPAATGTQVDLPDDHRARDDSVEFSRLLLESARRHGISEFLAERDYWMFQIASCLLAESERYPGSYTSMGGGSLLSLLGITERLSEDVDISVTFVDGASACSSNKSKALMVEYQDRVGAGLGIVGERQGGGGGNHFRTVRYPYVSVLAGVAAVPSRVNSDMGLRDAPREHLIEADGMPFLGRAVQRSGSPLPSDLAPRKILGTHPVEILANKFDAVCWREALVPAEGERALKMLTARIRDHYDIYRLIQWLRSNQMLNADSFAATVARSQDTERLPRQRMRVVRPEQPRPQRRIPHPASLDARQRRARGTLADLPAVDRDRVRRSAVL